MTTLKLDMRWLRRKTGERYDLHAGYMIDIYKDVLQWRWTTLDGLHASEWQDVRKEDENGKEIRY